MPHRGSQRSLQKKEAWGEQGQHCRASHAKPKQFVHRGSGEHYLPKPLLRPDSRSVMTRASVAP